MTVEARLSQLGIKVPDPRTPAGTYVPAIIHESLVYSAGQGSVDESGCGIHGQLGTDVDVSRGYEAARLCAINCLAAIRFASGDLDRIAGILFVRGFVNSAPGFAEQPSVLNGASDLLIELFGADGRHARSAIGVAALPKNFSVEVEVIAKLRP